MTHTEDSTESRLEKTCFVVQATSFEQHCLWSETSSASIYTRHATERSWEQINPGWVVQVGEFNSHRVAVAMTWYKIDGQLVMFWYPSSRIVDGNLIEEWIDQHFQGKWDGDTRPAKTDAMNFSHCLFAIDQINGKV